MYGILGGGLAAEPGGSGGGSPAQPQGAGPGSAGCRPESPNDPNTDQIIQKLYQRDLNYIKIIQKHTILRHQKNDSTYIEVC